MATRTLARGSRLSGSTIPVEVPADARTVRLRLDADFDAIAQKRSQDQTFIVRIDLAVSRDAGRSWRSSLSVTKHDATLIPDDARGGRRGAGCRRTPGRSAATSCAET